VRRARIAANDLAPARRTVHATPPGRTAPSADAFGRFGHSSWLVPPVVVRNPRCIDIGDGVGILEHSTLCVLDADDVTMGRLIIGDGVRLARFNTIVCGRHVMIGDGVASSDGVSILDTWRAATGPTRALAGLPPPDDAPVTIGRNAYLGCNSTIYPGVTIGDGAYIGEGAVVVTDVPPHTVVRGNPATATRRYDPSTEHWSDLSWA
jgi:acetyltransferase-like isoleucine patch superfamily enzyme